VFGRRQNETLETLRAMREEDRGRGNETIETLRAMREDDGEQRRAFRQFTAEMTLQLRRNGEEHRADMREIRKEMREAREEFRAEMREFREEMHAQRQALFAILDRLPPPPGEATA